MLKHLGAMVAFGGALVCRPALADHAECAVRMIQATHEDGGVDPKITRLRPYLEKEPFTAWKKFALVGEKELTLEPSGTERFALPNGKQASLTFLEHMHAAEKQNRHRVRLRLELHDGAQKVLATTFVLDEGGVVLQAGQKLGNGLLILGFSCALPNH